MRTRIKFCGCTNAQEAQTAVDLGVDAIGVIFAQQSPRRVNMTTAESIAGAVSAFVALVAVFVEPAASDVTHLGACGYIAQFSGNEPATFCETVVPGAYIKVHHVKPAAASAATPVAFASLAHEYTRARWMFDSAVDGKAGGTGLTFPWETARSLAGDAPIIVSGGLTADNVAECIRRVRPYAVDVRSGIETAGVKDVRKMRAFVRAVKEADAQT